MACQIEVAGVSPVQMPSEGDRCHLGCDSVGDMLARDICHLEVTIRYTTWYCIVPCAAFRTVPLELLQMDVTVLCLCISAFQYPSGPVW